MTYEQMSLLDLWVCRWCYREEPNEFLLHNNHVPECVRALRDHECVAMSLTRNHVISYARTVATGGAFIGCCHRHRKYDPECGLNELRARIQRVTVTWPAHKLTWVRTVLTSEHLGPDLVDELTAIAA